MTIGYTLLITALREQPPHAKGVPVRVGVVLVCWYSTKCFMFEDLLGRRIFQSASVVAVIVFHSVTMKVAQNEIAETWT